MSKATKRKHVTKEILEDYYIPEEDETIVKIIGGRGNNLHEVEASDGTKYLVSMPTKFRRNVWVKRGDFVVVSPIKEGVKVQGEIVYILFPKQIKYLKEENKWPSEFDEKPDKGLAEPLPQTNAEMSEKNEAEEHEELYENSSDNDDDLFQNPNHRTVYYEDDSETTSSEENTDAEEDGGGDDDDDYLEDHGKSATNNTTQETLCNKFEKL